MKQKLKIELYRYDNLVFGKILEMDDILRGNGKIWESKDGAFKIFSEYSPELGLDSFEVRGKDKDYDDDVFYLEFDDEEDAKEVCSYIKQGVAEINNEPSEEEDFSGIKKMI